MIPVEVSLSNFLGYDDNDGNSYVYDFADHRLWSISGDNGAGKSAIFDAITYCLFGRHRGGAQRDLELLHKGASDMSCSFTFEHFGVRYRVRRTLTKKTQRSGSVKAERACQGEWYDANEAAWRAIDGTTSVAGLEEYVRIRLLGFDYDTFVSSVLLLQGQSDKLMAAPPAQRFDYLSGILEFDRYRRLCSRAEERARELRARHGVLVHQLGQVAMPSDQELQNAEVANSKAEQDFLAATSRSREQQQRFDRVKSYHDVVERVQKLSEGVKQAEEAIERGPQIRAAASMQERLRVALPLMTSAYEAISQSAASDEKATAATKAAQMIDVAALETASEIAAADLDAATKAHEGTADQLRRCRREQESLQPRVDLARRLDDLDEKIRAAAEQVESLALKTSTFAEVSAQSERLDHLYRCLTSIQAFVRLRKSRDELLAGRTPSALEAELTLAADSKADAEAAGGKLERAIVARREAIAALKQRQSTLKAERAQRAEAGEEGTCARCGQRVSPEHIQAELERCAADLSSVENELAAATDQLAATSRELRAAQKRLQVATDVTEVARDRLRRVTDCQSEIARLEAAPFMADLPADCREALYGAWDGAAAALTGWEKEVLGRSRLAKELERLRALIADRTSQEQLVLTLGVERRKVLDVITRDAAQAALASSATLAQRAHELEAEEIVLAADVRSRTDAMENARSALSQGQLEKAKLESDAKSHTADAVSKRASADQLTAAVDAEFLPPSVERIRELEERFDQLADAQTRLASLMSAETEVHRWRGQLLEAEEAIARVPEAERLPLDTAATDLRTALQAEATAEGVRSCSRDALNEMLRARSEHLQRQEQANQVNLQRQVWQRVALLLGRSGLQLALLKRDLHEIELRASPLLQQISGGCLTLRIECAEGRGNREEIHFSCVDAASADEPLDVSFLSGGQKFRVAVAVAAGIGQYAGLGAAMPSQIIDEGFGSLDEIGRKEMLEAIRDMSEHYERIIVVSHTDSFHDPSLFPARYELRKEGRRTLVTATV